MSASAGSNLGNTWALIPDRRGGKTRDKTLTLRGCWKFVNGLQVAIAATLNTTVSAFAKQLPIAVNTGESVNQPDYNQSKDGHEKPLS